MTIDATAPSLAITSNVAQLKIGETATITFTFSEDPGATFAWDGSSGDIVVTGGTLGAISGSGLTRTATFTPTAGANAGSAGITVASGAYTDAAGNSGGAGTTPALTFDTLAPNAPSAPDLTSDAGASSTDNLTSATTPTFTGTAESGSTVTLFDTDGTTVLGTGTATGGAWSITSSTLAAGAHTITAKASDAAGNTGAESSALTVMINNSLPPLSGTISISDSALKSGDTATVTFTFSEAVSGFTTDDLTVQNGSLSNLSSSDGGVTWTATLTPQGDAEIEGNVIRLELGGVQDSAGNAGTGSASSDRYEIDTRQPGVTISSDTLALSSGHSAELTFTLSEASNTFGVDDVSVSGGTLSDFSGSGTSYSARFTPAPGLEGSASVSVQSLAFADAAGNFNTGAGSLQLTVHTVAVATPSTPELDAGSDSGSSAADHATNDRTPLITGTAADGTTVTLYDTDGVTVLGIAVANGGVWGIVSAELSDGSHSLTIRSADAHGNISAASDALAVLVDTRAPAAPAPASVVAGGNPVAAAPFLLQGDGAEANALITLRIDDTVVGSVSADAGGHWQLGVQAVAVGVHQVTLTATDASGNQSASSAPLQLSVAAPFTQPPAPAPEPAPVRADPPAALAASDQVNTSPLNLTMQNSSAGPGNGTAPPAPAAPQVPLADGRSATGANGVASGNTLVLNRDLPDLSVQPGQNLTFSIPRDTFVASGSGGAVVLSASLADGAPLPSWLAFDPASGTFSGEPPPGSLVSLTLRVTAKDSDGNEVSVEFKIEGGVKSSVPKPPLEPQAQLSGQTLLATLGLHGKRGPASHTMSDDAGSDGVKQPDAVAGEAASADDERLPDQAETPPALSAPQLPHARQLSEQLARAAGRFAHGSDATLRHLAQVQQIRHSDRSA